MCAVPIVFLGCRPVIFVLPPIFKLLIDNETILKNSVAVNLQAVDRSTKYSSLDHFVQRSQSTARDFTLVVRQLKSSHQTVVRQLSNSHMTIVGQVIVGLLSCDSLNSLKD